MSDLSDMDAELDAIGGATAGDRSSSTHRHHQQHKLANSVEKVTTDPMEVCGEEEVVGAGIGGMGDAKTLQQSTKNGAFGSNNGTLSGARPPTATPHGDSTAVLDLGGGGMGPGGDADPGKDPRLLRRELVTFAHDVMVKRTVIKLAELRREFYLKLSQVAQGHVLSSGVSDRMLEEAVLSAGGFQLNKPVSCRGGGGQGGFCSLFFSSALVVCFALGLYFFLGGSGFWG